MFVVVFVTEGEKIAFEVELEGVEVEVEVKVEGLEVEAEGVELEVEGVVAGCFVGVIEGGVETMEGLEGAGMVGVVIFTVVIGGLLTGEGDTTVLLDLGELKVVLLVVLLVVALGFGRKEETVALGS